MKSITLNGNFRLYSFNYKDTPNLPSQLNGNYICATVPGNVELDYQNAGILEDVFVKDNCRKTASLEMLDFWYVKDFELNEEVQNRKLQLCFDGVDTIAEYFLNDIKIGESDNMFISHTFDVTNVINKGKNTLAVHIHSAVAWAKKFDIQPYNVAFSECYENLHIRKSAINYGWDISPRLISAGIWRKVSLNIIENYDFKDIYISTAAIYDNNAVLVLSCNADIPDEYIGKCKLVFKGKCKEQQFCLEYPFLHRSCTVYPNIVNAKLWYPLGYGDQNLYDAILQIVCEGNILAERKLRFGIRLAKLKYGDQIGENGEFAFYINNKLVRCKGANWVPMSLLQSQSSAYYEEAVGNFRDSNCNMVRVWGGGVYEDDKFFDLCDEYGIMVWQDIMLSCHAYPMTNDFYKKMCVECENIAMRIRNHPSLVMYCGGNETDWPYVCTGLDPNDDIISRDALKSTLFKFDPYRSYLPSTPYFSREFIRSHGGRFYIDFDEIRRERTELPQEHYWWHREDFLEFREQNHKFISEIGYSSSSERSSLERYLPEGYSFDDDSSWDKHSYPTEGGRQIGNNYLFENIPENDDDKILASQYYQAEAYKFIVELSRIRSYNNGILLWTMRENWPSFSSALVDYYGVRKRAFFAVKAAYEPLQCAIDINNGRAECYLINDLMDAKVVTVSICDEQGKAIFSGDISTEENTPVVHFATLSIDNIELISTTIKNDEEIIKNYRYVYSDKIDFVKYDSLYKTVIKDICGVK